MNYHIALTALQIFASQLNARMGTYLSPIAMNEARSKHGIKPALDTLREWLRDKDQGNRFMIDLSTGNPTGTIKVLLGLPVEGESKECLGMATFGLLYWTDKDTLDIDHFSIMGPNEGFRSPHIGISYTERSDRNTYGLEIEALNAEAWKRVRDTLEALLKDGRFSPEAQRCLQTLLRIAPVL